MSGCDLTCPAGTTKKPTPASPVCFLTATPTTSPTSCATREVQTTGLANSSVELIAGCDGFVSLAVNSDEAVAKIDKVEGGQQYIAVCDDESVRDNCSTGLCCTPSSVGDNESLLCNRDGTFLAKIPKENGQFCP